MITDELIARRPQGRAGLADWYASVFEAQRAEGMTTVELATLLEVTATTLYYWKRRLRERNRSVHCTETERPEVGLVEVRLALPAEHHEIAPACKPLELRLVGGHSILVPLGFEPDFLRALVRVLETC